MTDDPRLKDAALEPAAVDWSRVERLEWVQPRALSRRWVLLADGEPAVVLTQAGFWHRGYSARTHAAEWAVLEPFWGPTRVRRADAAAPALEARFRWPGDHQVARADGEPLLWKRQGWTTWSHVLENREKFPLLRVREGFGLLRTGASVELLEAARGLADLEPLLVLGWVLQLRSHRARTR